ncbi:uncharacterized protein LOC119355590 [Triticum dicoccoides]|uniref:uncharacterized protein LOC119355590 n=1 Tax=Triticum dicoccoides TaxID=85692 RepID=UPI00188DFD42|nr:uncharacterized protein LOC119355590 [Triticum dicoccoides]
MVLNGVLFLLVCAAARAAASGGDGPLLNGNFEQAPNRSQMNGSRVTGKYAIPHWKATGFVEYIECGAKQDHMVLVVPEGRHAVRLGTDSSIEHQLSVTRGKYYSVTFSAARTCAQSERLSVSIVPGDASGGELPVQTVYTSSGWDSYAWAFKARQGVVSLVIHHGDDQVDDPACGPIVDAVAIRTLNPPHATHQNMLINGGFEEGPYMTPGSPWGVLVPPMDEDATSPLPGWAIMSYSKVVKYIDAAHFRVPHGSRAVELVAGVEVALVQEVATVPGRSYRLQFSVGDAGNRCAASPMSVQVATAYGGKRVSYESRGTGGFVRDKLDFKAEGNSTRVVFYSTGYHTTSDSSGTLCGPVVDDVSLVSVSHPHARRLLR